MALVASLTAPAGSVSAGEPPSVVFIVTDDQRWDTLWAMPTVQRDLQGRGVTFEQAFVTNPLCCPSRATILTGQYSHTTGVWRGKPPYGGFEAFDDTSSIAVRLSARGYHTGLFGKYLNGYWRANDGRTGYVPPGWDRWVAFTRSGFFDYSLNIDGTIGSFGSAPNDYSTDVLAAEAERFIRRMSGPLFMVFTPYAPHNPATPAPRHADAFSDAVAGRPPSYNEERMGDKPKWLRRLKPLTEDQLAFIDARHRDRLRTLLSVDEAVERILRALEQTGRLSNTLVVFTSDNGFLNGEHRWKAKMIPHEESIRVPMVVRFDPLISTPRTDRHLVVNIDLAPTALDLAGLSTVGMDGRSLLPLLSDPQARWRTAFLIERLEKSPTSRVPSYCGVRTRRYSFVVYGRTAEAELYDLRRDPYQLRNVAARGRYERQVARLTAKLRRLCDPPPPGYVVP